MKPLGQLQVSLSRAAKVNKNRKFYSLRDKICRMDVLEEAWRRVRANHGAAGIDRQTIEDIERQGVQQFLLRLQKELLDGTYEVQCIRRVYIPKPNGKRRPLGIPTVKDRVVQQAVNLIIGPIFETDFQPFSFGYRPDKSAKDASNEVYKYLNFGLTNVVEVDIRSFFDNINHSKLISFVLERIADGYIIRLIRKWLRAGIVYMDSVTYPEQGTAQGGVISPLLANIFLNKLDSAWSELQMNDAQKNNAQMVRYADDIIILTDTRYRAGVASEILSEILSGLDLKLSEEKSRIVTAEEGFDFLGFHFVRRYYNRKRKDVTWFYPSKKSIGNFKQKMRETVSVRYAHVKAEQSVIKDVNRLILGWTGYFNHGNPSKVYSKLERFVQWRLVQDHRAVHKGKSGTIKSVCRELYQHLGLESVRRQVSHVRTLSAYVVK